MSNYRIYSIKDPIEFKNSATGDFESIMWDFGDGSKSAEDSPKHIYLREGLYTVNQKVTYALGCIYDSSTTLKIEKGYEVIIPNAFTPNNNGLNDTFRPVFKGLKKIKTEIFNTLGDLLFSEEGDALRGWTGLLNGSLLPNGNYYYKIIGVTFYGDEIEYKGPFILIRKFMIRLIIILIFFFLSTCKACAQDPVFQVFF